MAITVEQIRAARGALRWHQSTLAAAAGMATISIRKIENSKTRPRASSMGKIEAALRTAGIEFGDETVALKRKEARG